MFKIGSLNLKSNIILAPMAGITDLPFRMLSRKFGCQTTFVEMINCRCLGYKSKKTQKMLSSSPEDRPLGVQILGSESNYIEKALDVLRKYQFDILDFNAACPERKVTRRQEGASLLKDPKKLNLLLKILVKNSTVPVTVKIRSGWDKNSINAKEVALYAQDAGVKAVFIHGRTKEQGYKGNVDYGVIKEVKRALEVPLIASGDVLSAQLAKKMFDETGCDGLLVARGSLGNPWIFNEIKEFLKNGRLPLRPDKEELIKVMTEHLKSCVDYHGSRNGVVIYRKFFAWYTKSMDKVRKLRERTSRAKSQEEMLSIIKELSLSQG